MIRSVDDSETQESSSELVTKYYNNAKRLYTFRNIKKFFSWSAKAFSMMLMPLKIVAKPFMKLKNILGNVAKNLLGITKMLIDRSLDFLITPAGIYAVGFTIGLVVGFIK